MRKRTLTTSPRGGLRALFGSAAVLWISIGPLSAWAQELFVPNRAGNAVDVYKRTANFNEAPRRTLFGSATALDHPKVIVVDPVNNELVVLNAGVPNAPSVTVYERTASGNIAPIRTLAGANTGLSSPLAMAVDPVNNELFVLNFDNTSMTASVTVHSRIANGNIAPVRTLVGPATALNPAPGLVFQALVVDTANNELFVANGNSNSVTVYDRMAGGNTAPIRTLSGLDAPCGLAVDTVNSELFVTDPLVEAINVYPRTANGNATRIRFFSAFGGGPQPCGLSLDLVSNELFVTEPGQFPPHRVSTYSRTATSSNAVPIRRLQVSDPGSASVPITTSPAPNAHTTVGLYRPNNSIFFLRNGNTYGFGEVMVSVGFAAPGDLPVAGDWDGNGTTTVGLFRPSTNTFLLRNSNDYIAGAPDVTVTHGATGDLPVVGDWDGNGTTTIGLYRPSENKFFLWNSNITNPPDFVVNVGAPGDLPVVGDWDGNGTTTIGLFRPSTNTFYLWNSNAAGPPDVVVTVGASGDLPVAGDWDGNGTTTIGLFRPGNSTFYLWNSNVFGAPDLVIPFGGAADLPVVGNWDGL